MMLYLWFALLIAGVACAVVGFCCTRYEHSRVWFVLSLSLIFAAIGVSVFAA